jgi:Flp pilus assembly protein TadG
MALRDVARTFTHDRSGNFGITFVVLSGVITTAIAFGLETSRLASNEAHIQTISDSAAIYGAKLLGDKSLSDTDISELVKTFVIAQLTGSGIGAFDEIGSKIGVDRANGNVSVQTAAVGDLFLPFLSTGPVALTAVSEAGATMQTSLVGPGLCGLALNETEKDAMNFKGEGNVITPDCVFWSNSRRKDATKGLGGGNIEVRRVCSVGSYGSLLGYAVLPPPEDNCVPLNDPLAGWVPPTARWGICDYGAPDSPRVIDGGGQDVTLLPGTYCGGLFVENARNVTFRPGQYFFNGDTKVEAAVRLAGDGIYLHFGSDAQKAELKGDFVEMTNAADAALMGIL